MPVQCAQQEKWVRPRRSMWQDPDIQDWFLPRGIPALSQSMASSFAFHGCVDHSLVDRAPIPQLLPVESKERVWYQQETSFSLIPGDPGAHMALRVASPGDRGDQPFVRPLCKEASRPWSVVSWDLYAGFSLPIIFTFKYRISAVDQGIYLVAISANAQSHSGLVLDKVLAFSVLLPHMNKAAVCCVKEITAQRAVLCRVLPQLAPYAGYKHSFQEGVQVNRNTDLGVKILLSFKISWKIAYIFFYFINL